MLKFASLKTALISTNQDYFPALRRVQRACLRSFGRLQQARRTALFWESAKRAFFARLWANVRWRLMWQSRSERRYA